VVDRCHTKGLHLRLKVAADTAHTQDTENLALRIVAVSWRWVASPLALSQCLHRCVEVSESSEDQEDRRVCCAVVYCGWHVADEEWRATLCACVHVYLIIAGALERFSTSLVSRYVCSFALMSPRLVSIWQTRTSLTVQERM